MGKGGEIDQHDRKPVAQEAIATLSSGVNALDTFGVIIFFVVIVEIVLLIGLNIYEKSRIDSLTGTISKTQTELNSDADKTINNQIGDVVVGADKLKTALDAKVPWSKLFVMVNAVTPKDVVLHNFTVNDSGSFKADGETISLTSLAQAVVAWRDGTADIVTPFSSVTLGGNSYTNDATTRKVTFSISGQVNIEALRSAK